MELESAKRMAAEAGCLSHRIVKLDPDLFHGTALVAHSSSHRPGSDPDVPLDLPVDRPVTNETIPVTYVPARNTLFLSHALALAESLQISVIFIGANALDYSGYPDCRPEFLEAFERMANLGTERGVNGKPFKIEAPLLHLTKSGIIRKGMSLGLDYSLTRSCYNPDMEGRACGRCDSCQLRLKGFAEAGLKDPAPYQNH